MFADAAVFFPDRDWWAWNGWTAVAAIVASVATLVALATLWFFWRQLVEVRAQTREQAEQQQKTLDVIHGQLDVAREQAKEVKAIATVAVLFTGVGCGIVVSAGAHVIFDELMARLRPGTRVERSRGGGGHEADSPTASTPHPAPRPSPLIALGVAAAVLLMLGPAIFLPAASRSTG